VRGGGRDDGTRHFGEVECSILQGAATATDCNTLQHGDALHAALKLSEGVTMQYIVHIQSPKKILEHSVTTRRCGEESDTLHVLHARDNDGNSAGDEEEESGQGSAVRLGLGRVQDCVDMSESGGGSSEYDRGGGRLTAAWHTHWEGAWQGDDDAGLDDGWARHDDGDDEGCLDPGDAIVGYQGLFLFRGLLVWSTYMYIHTYI